jgi:hypothetical protein
MAGRRKKYLPPEQKCSAYVSAMPPLIISSNSGLKTIGKPILGEK